MSVLGLQSQSLLAAFLLLLTFGHGFSPRLLKDTTTTVTIRPNCGTVLGLRRRNRSYDSDDIARQQEEGGIPLLPPSSMMKSPLWTPPVADDNDKSSTSSTDGAQQEHKQQSSVPFATNRKFELQYTCKVCETRNFNRVSRAAYRNGVVISQCKGCKSHHLIADHLGFTNLWDKEEHGGNIEEFFSRYQGMDDVVSRVSTEVFDLERTLSHDTSGGSIVGEDGEQVLE